MARTTFNSRYLFDDRFPNMKRTISILLATAVVASIVFKTGVAPAAAQRPTTVDRQRRAAEVKQEFLHAWNGYQQYAWGHDELKPLSKTSRDWYEHTLLMTPVDALDTMLLMGLQDEAAETKAYILDHLSFDQDMYVQVFEITIRHLGALLTCYQMTGDKRLLDLATDLGHRLLPAFKSATGLPYRYVNLKTGQVRDGVSNPAETGTLLIEFGSLSKITRNPIFYNAAKRALTETFNRRSAIGLVGDGIDVETGKWTSTDSHVSGGIDSYYEYLLKCWLLFGDRDCLRMWQASQTAINKYLADDNGRELWYGHADMRTGKRTGTTYGALDAFFPAILALGGDLKRARRLQDSGYRMWQLHGIEPEELNYRTMEVTHGGYPLRPEFVESAYYLYHYSGNQKYLRMGETVLDSLRQYCRTETGYAGLTSVVTKEKRDNMQSFLFAETFKYLYLLFAPPETLKFDQVIFNTEAHPIWRARLKRLGH
jgi:mannosidase alpha-like ER degradation enhancer 2